MERKNTILLTVIAVATLLVAVVGATFAYFTATTTSTGSGGETTGTTAASAEGATLTLNPAGVERQLDYPGGFAYVGASATATKTESTDTNDYDLSFKVNYTITNQTKTELSYTLYKTNAQITNARTCNLVQDTTTQPGETRSKFVCTGDNTYGTAIASGKVAASTDGTTAVTVTQANETGAGAQAEQELSTTGTTTAYYYLVIDYPNSDTVDQSDDQGKTISAQINGVGSLTSVKKTS